MEKTPAVDVEETGGSAMEVSKMSEKVKKLKKLEIGAGDQPRPGYIHNDVRPLSHIELVCNAWEIEGEGVYDEIVAAHILEHVHPAPKMQHVVLKRWFELLKVGGLLSILAPNHMWLVDQLVAGNLDMEGYSHNTFAAQNYAENTHYIAFDKKYLSELLIGNGFKIERFEQGTTHSVTRLDFEKADKPGMCYNEFLVHARRK